MTEVRVGQVWADNDPRMLGRTLRVDDVRDGKAACVVLTPGRFSGPSVVGRRVRISLKRFRPTHNGYRLVTEAEG